MARILDKMDRGKVRCNDEGDHYHCEYGRGKSVDVDKVFALPEFRTTRGNRGWKEQKLALGASADSEWDFEFNARNCAVTASGRNQDEPDTLTCGPGRTGYHATFRRQFWD